MIAGKGGWKGTIGVGVGLAWILPKRPKIKLINPSIPEGAGAGEDEIRPRTWEFPKAKLLLWTPPSFQPQWIIRFK